MTWILGLVISGLLMTAWLVGSRSEAQRLRALERAGLVKSWEEAQDKLGDGWQMLKIDFGFGLELWIAPAVDVDRRARVFCGGFRVIPTSAAEFDRAQLVYFRTK